MKISFVISTLYPAFAAAFGATCAQDEGICTIATDCCKGYTCKATPGAASRCVVDKACVATGMLCNPQTAKCCGDFACTRVLGNVGICVSNKKIFLL